MFCKTCGKEINDMAVICPNCGCSTGKNASGADADEPANGGLMFLSFLIPIVGVILGIINLSNGKTRAGKAYLTMGLVVGIISGIIMVMTM